MIRKNSKSQINSKNETKQANDAKFYQCTGLIDKIVITVPQKIKFITKIYK
jgi:hypothetical protein